LIDAGASAKRLELALRRMDIDIPSLKAIFITHEHIDHVSALRVFASRYSIDVYASEGTLRALDGEGHLEGNFDAYIMGTGGAEAGDMRITAFNTSHDSSESLGFCVETPDGRKITTVTDTGVITGEIAESLERSDLVLIESNHDLRMLETGPYPYYLKRRIKSDRGHLSNRACGETLQKLVRTGTARIVLGHLSEENNRPGLARETSERALTQIGAEEGRDYELYVAPPGPMEKMIIF